MENCGKRELLAEYTVIAGVNGSGKSTIYKSDLIEIPSLGVRINLDELIYKEYNNQWNDYKIQVKAGKRIVKEIDKCLIEKISFNQETTLSSRSIIQTIKKARLQGFKVTLYYIGLEDVRLSHERVYNRIIKGGHGVDKDLIDKRYKRSFENLYNVLPLCDNVYIYDNSNVFVDIIKVKHNKVIFISDEIPEYFKPIINSYLEHIKIYKIYVEE